MFMQTRKYEIQSADINTFFVLRLTKLQKKHLYAQTSPINSKFKKIYTKTNSVKVIQTPRTSTIPVSNGT